MDKVYQSCQAALADIRDGASIAISGAQGPIGIPNNLILALGGEGGPEPHFDRADARALHQFSGALRFP